MPVWESSGRHGSLCLRQAVYTDPHLSNTGHIWLTLTARGRHAVSFQKKKKVTSVVLEPTELSRGYKSGPSTSYGGPTTIGSFSASPSTLKSKSYTNTAAFSPIDSDILLHLLPICAPTSLRLFSNRSDNFVSIHPYQQHPPRTNSVWRNNQPSIRALRRSLLDAACTSAKSTEPFRFRRFFFQQHLDLSTSGKVVCTTSSHVASFCLAFIPNLTLVRIAHGENTWADDWDVNLVEPQGYGIPIARPS